MPASQSDWWPEAAHDWPAAQMALHLRSQMLGKTRLALAPMQNHWWHTTLYVTARGLATSAMPYGDRNVEIELDLLDHQLVARTSDGVSRALPLRSQPIAEFYADYQALLHSLDIDVQIWPMPVEIADPVRFTEDRRALEYDQSAVERFFHMLMQADRSL